LDLVLSEPRIARLLRKVGVEENADKAKGGVKIAKNKKNPAARKLISKRAGP